MPEFFEHADAMLVTLADQDIFSMTIPGKIQSYLAMGKPVIAALNGEGADIIRNASAGITCPAGSSEGLAAAVLKLSQLTVGELQALGKNGLEFSKREFDRQLIVGMAEKYLSGLYELK
jgi:glycosyltransferase involved in cell wall biosynthesis